IIAFMADNLFELAYRDAEPAAYPAERVALTHRVYAGDFGGAVGGGGCGLFVRARRFDGLGRLRRTGHHELLSYAEVPAVDAVELDEVFCADAELPRDATGRVALRDRVVGDCRWSGFYVFSLGFFGLNG